MTKSTNNKHLKQTNEQTNNINTNNTTLYRIQQ